MVFDTERVRRHYEQGAESRDMVSRVCQQIDALEGRFLSAAQTAALDQFHSRGLVATFELAQMVGLTGSMQVLDAGSGLGGPPRYLAETYGCSVVGLDLTPSYVALSRHLAHRSEPSERLRYERGDLLAIPFEGGAFDLAWTWHVLMNVRERVLAYSEFHRVLKPGGKLACYVIVSASAKSAIEFPVPRASEPEASRLLTLDETLVLTSALGFELVARIDATRLALNWFGQQPPWHPQSLSLASVGGLRIHAMAGNLARSRREGRLGVAMFVSVRNP